MALIHDISDLDFELDELDAVPPPDRLLLADPEHYEVTYAINPHMRSEDGELERVDRGRAREQWQALRETCEGIGLSVDVLPPLEGHPDLVFCANQVLPVPAEATPHREGAIVPSHMAAAQRQEEVPHVLEHFQAAGHRVEPLRTTSEPMEGMGDGIWHPGRRLLWAGVGPRSSEAAWREVAARYRLTVIPLELVDHDFYHLDTCLVALSESTCLWLPQALSRVSQKRVQALFTHCIEADELESRERLACNAWSPDGERVLIQRGAPKTLRRLRAGGFEALELDTDEFLKSGGSVFCMKLAYWSPRRAA
jgi:N-dimethylarginine dimethylaminohydrolase